jgi:hypothetical protein
LKSVASFKRKSGSYYSANWFIGRSYQILLQSDGLTYLEVSRMLDCYSIYLRLQPHADDALSISSYVRHIKSIRPSDNVEKWINKPQVKKTLTIIGNIKLGSETCYKITKTALDQIRFKSEQNHE